MNSTNQPGIKAAPEGEQCGAENTHRNPREERGKHRQVFGGLIFVLLSGCSSMPPAKHDQTIEASGLVCAEKDGRKECH
jgi:hypothetical protein